MTITPRRASFRVPLAILAALALSVCLWGCQPRQPGTEGAASGAVSGAVSGATGPEVEGEAFKVQATDLAEELQESYELAGFSVVVVRGQESLLNEGFGQQSHEGELAFDPELSVNLFSATKVLTSLSVLSLVEDGLVDLEATIGDLMAEAPPAWREIPFWRLLNHTTGIPMIVNQPEFGALLENPSSGDQDVVDFVKNLPLDYEPGSASRYRQSGYAILTKILEQEVGKSWLELVEEHVTTPAGMLETRYPDVASGAREVPLLPAAGGYQTTGDDMVRLFQALNAGRIVSSETLRQELFASERVFDGYSLGSVLKDFGESPTLGHTGGGARAYVRYSFDRGIGVALFTDKPQPNYDAIFVLGDRLLEVLLAGEPPGSLKRPLAVSLDQLRAERGDQFAAHDLLEVYEEAKRTGDLDLERSEQTLNGFGYSFLQADKTEDALEVFLKNTEDHPDSANTFDSLGEAFRASGNLEEARANYSRVLLLQPENRYAAAVLFELCVAPDTLPLEPKAVASRREALLSLDQQSFDQDFNRGWRSLSVKDHCGLAAADLLSDYRDRKYAEAQGSVPEDVDILYWHEGQLRAMAEQNEKAIGLFEKSYGPQSSPEWVQYAKATLAFLRQDEAALVAAREALNALPEPEGFKARAKEVKEQFNLEVSWPTNLDVVDGLVKCLDEPYSVAYGPKCR